MKRIISFLMVAVMVVACMAPTVFAAGFVVTTEAVTAKTGSTVDVAVSITGNTGYTAYGLQVEYDTAALELIEVTAGEKSNGLLDANLANGKVAFAASQVMTGDGKLFTLTFKVKATALKQYAVKVVWDAKSSDLAAAPTIVNGSVTVVCSNHIWNDGELTTNPGCETPGEKTFTCTVPGCGVTKTEPVAATGHSWGNWTVTTKPGCQTEGEETRTCSVCNHPETRKVAATGHNWGQWTVTTKPTCTEAGEETRTCDTCKGTETRKVAATGHSWGSWTVIKNPTHTEHGAQSRTCSVCNETETRAIAALGHTIGEGWLHDDQGHWHKCSCGEILDKEAHKLKWVITKDPTDTESGLKHQECETCGWRGEDVEIPANSDGTTVPTEPDTEPGDGDSKGFRWWILIVGLILLVGILFIFFFLYKRKKDEEEETKKGPDSAV